MVQVPTIEEFQAYVQRIERVEQEYDFLKSLLTGNRWLNRNQAMIALGIKDDKLRALTLNGMLIHRYEGTRPFYDVFSIRDYLADRKIDRQEIDRRILRAAHKA
ncbi:hypothetical protein [Spirosoma gilvum]